MNTSFPTQIRDARDDEFEAIGRLHASALTSCQRYQERFSGIAPDDVLDWCWIQGAKGSAARGSGTVLVIERTDTKELLGVVWYRKINQANPPNIPQYPKGSDEANQGRNDKWSVARFNWLSALLEKYGEFILVTEFAVAPAYQGNQCGKALLHRVLADAETQGLNIAGTPVPGQASYYSALVKGELANRATLTHDSVGGVDTMFLEIFKPKQE